MPAPSPSPDGPRPSRPDETRARNLRIATSARAHRFDPTGHVPFLCECSDDRCTELLRMTLAEWDELRRKGHRFVAPGHQVAGAAIVRVKGVYWIYRTDEGA